MAGQVLGEGVDAIRRQHDGGVRLDDGAVVRRIEVAELFLRHVGEARRRFDVHRPRRGDGGEIGAVRNEGQIQAGKGLRVADDVLQCLQLGHVMPRFLGHGEIGVIGGQAAGFVLFDGPFDGTFTPVVRGQRQMPVAMHVVDGLQVIECGTGGGDHIAPFILPPVLFQLEALAGSRDELPESGGCGRRMGHRIERTFHHRQQGQFARHAARFQFLDDVVQVGPAAFDHAPQRFRSVHVPLLVMQDQFIIQVHHRKTMAQAIPEVGLVQGEVDGQRQFRGRRQFGDAQAAAVAIGKMCGQRGLQAREEIGFSADWGSQRGDQ